MQVSIMHVLTATKYNPARNMAYSEAKTRFTWLSSGWFLATKTAAWISRHLQVSLSGSFDANCGSRSRENECVSSTTRRFWHFTKRTMKIKKLPTARQNGPPKCRMFFGLVVSTKQLYHGLKQRDG